MSVFAFVSCAFGVIFKNLCQDWCQEAFFTIFSLTFKVSGLTVKSLIHFLSESIFVSGVRKLCNFILPHVVIQFSQCHLLKRLTFPHYVFLVPLWKISLLKCVGLFLDSLFHWPTCLVFMPILYCLFNCSFVI